MGEETRILKNIMQRLTEYYDFDGYHVHGSMFQRIGEPDIDGSIALGLDEYTHIKLEVKTPTGSPTPIQIYRVRVYHHRDYMAGIVTSYEDVQDLIHAYLCGTYEDLPDPYGLYGAWHDDH